MTNQLKQHDAIVAIFADHRDAENAVRKLASDGFDLTHFSIVGQGFHSDEKVVGFYNIGDRIKFWGKNGAFWGGIWSLFLGGIFLTVPAIGPVMVVGHLAAMVVAAVEGAVLVSGVSALGAALFSIGIPRDSVIQYEETIKTDKFLVIANGSADEMSRAKAILESSNPMQLHLHKNVNAQQGDETIHATAMHASYPPGTAPGSLQNYAHEDSRYFGTQNAEAPPTGNTFQDTMGEASHSSFTPDDVPNQELQDAQANLRIGSHNDIAAYRYGKEMHTEDKYHDCSWEEVQGRLKDGWEARATSASPWGQSENAVRRGWHSMSPDLDDDSYYRAHWNAIYANTASEGDYDDRVPAYLYGSEARRSEKYRSRNWHDVEGELEAEWAAHHAGQLSSWGNFKDAVKHGWNRASSGMDTKDAAL
jgi:hypothetical protein